MRKKEFLRKLTEAIESKFTTAELMTCNTLAKLSCLIANKRISMGMDQKEFAQFMEVSEYMVSRWERGDYDFTISLLAHIADKFDMDIVDLINGGEEDENI